MRIYFRSRGGKTHGWGDIVRLASIAENLYKKKNQVIFIYEGDNFIKNYLKNFSFKKIRLPENIKLKNEIKIIKKLENASHIFIEMLNINLNLQNFYKTKTEKLIIIDDILDKKYSSDFTISCQDNKKNKAKLVRSKNNKIYIGSKFFPFDKEIIEESKKKENKFKSISSLLIFLGGGDYSKAYIKIAKSLRDLKYKKITFITSKSNYKNIFNELKKIRRDLLVLNGVKRVGKLFNKNDTAIVAGGFTKYEAAIMGVPSLVISTQWHQIKLSANFCKKTGCDHLGHFSQINENEIYNSLKKLFNIRKRKKIIKNYKKIVDINGLDKIFNIVGIR